MSPLETTDHWQRTTDALSEYFDLIQLIPHTCDRSGHTDRKFFKYLFWEVKMKQTTSNINRFIPFPQRSKTGKARCVFYEMRRSRLRFFSEWINWFERYRNKLRLSSLHSWHYFILSRHRSNSVCRSVPSATPCHPTASVFSEECPDSSRGRQPSCGSFVPKSFLAFPATSPPL